MRNDAPDGRAPTVVPVVRWNRTIGVIIVDDHGARWQPTRDVEGLIGLATLTAGAVTAVGLLAAARRRPRVQDISMGPGGWVSFKGGAPPRLRGPRRPWWAVLLRARPLE